MQEKFFTIFQGAHTIHVVKIDIKEPYACWSQSRTNGKEPLNMQGSGRFRKIPYFQASRGLEETVRILFPSVFMPEAAV